MAVRSTKTKITTKTPTHGQAIMSNRRKTKAKPGEAKPQKGETV